MSPPMRATSVNTTYSTPKSRSGRISCYVTSGCIKVVPQRASSVARPKGGAPEYDWRVNRAKKAWEEAGLEAIGFHECRHSYITHLIHSGLNGKAVQTLAGHASIQVTFDTYGHVFDGHEDEAGRLLASYYCRGTSITDDVEEMSREDLIALVRSLVDTNVSPVSTSVSTSDTEGTK